MDDFEQCNLGYEKNVSRLQEFGKGGFKQSRFQDKKNYSNKHWWRANNWYIFRVLQSEICGYVKHNYLWSRLH